MMGVVNRDYKEIIRSKDHPWNKWLVTYEEWPKDKVGYEIQILSLCFILLTSLFSGLNYFPLT